MYETWQGQYNCGIFQGDSISPLSICLSLIPITNELNKTKYGCEIYEETINHLFHTDDLNLYAKNGKELEVLFITVKPFSDGIGIDLGQDKCAKTTFIQGKIAWTIAVELDIDTAFVN